MEQNLFEKYNIVHVNGCRYYKVDLKVKAYDFENTIPYCIKINEVLIFDSSWKNMIPKIVEELDSKNPKTEEELLAITSDWSKQCIFGKVKKANFTPYKNIYINTNHTAVHAMWIIQQLLKEYSVSLDKCEFIIKRQPAAEPLEVREFYKNEVIKGFEIYLREKLNKSDKFVNNILKNMQYLNNNFLSKISTGYNDIFLIEEPSYFTNYSKKIIELMENKGIAKQVTDGISKQLNYLFSYIKKVNADNKLKYKNYSHMSIDDSSIEDFLDDFDAYL